jgi:hypothetical protein
MASSFLPILSYDDADVSEAAVASASPPQQAAKTAAAASVEAQPPRRTIAVPPAPPGGRNEAGLDTGVLDSVLRRFRAVDLGAEAGVAAPNAADNPMPAAQKRVVPPGGKPAVKKKAAAPPTPEEAAKAAQLAAEAAARRAAAEAGLRAKQERSSAALSAVEWMLEHTAGSEAELRQRALGPLTAGEFEEAMRERALSGVCGCPLCDAPLTCVPPRRIAGVIVRLMHPFFVRCAGGRLTWARCACLCVSTRCFGARRRSSAATPAPRARAPSR